MMLYIMRHGLAEAAPPDGDDGARRLTEDGREKILRAAAGLRTLKLNFDAILTSPVTRAAETAEIVAREMASLAPPQMIPELATGSSPSDLLVALKHLPPQPNLMLVGHEPTLSGLASLLITGSPAAARIRLKQGGVIAIEVAERLDRGKARLRWMLTQRQLRRLGK